jgi:predicted GH43/DUF377 family glycosyl hydrolase
MVHKLLLLLLLTIFYTGIANSQEGSELLQEENSAEFSKQCDIIPESGILFEKGVTRRDPSDVIKVGDRYYMWYTKITKDDPGYPSGYHGTIFYATSTNQRNWTEQGQALDRGQEDVWDGYGVFTPNILVADGRYYLFYTGVAPGFSNYPYNGYKEGPATPTAIGIAVAASPDGPWKRFDENPILTPNEPGNWDDFRVDDACLITRDGQYWLYYKGRQEFDKKTGTPMGLARANFPTGPYKRCEKNPLIGPGHEVLVWPHDQGVAALVAGSCVVWYSPDGLQFEPRAKLERSIKAPGAYRPDAFTNTDYGKGITWGITMQRKGDEYFNFSEMGLSVFKCMLNAN